MNNHGTNRMKMRGIVVIVFASLQVAWGQEGWMTVNADNHMKYEIPSVMEASPENGKGEFLWVNRFSSPDGAFRLESNGFNPVAREAAKQSMNSRQYIIAEELCPEERMSRL